LIYGGSGVDQISSTIFKKSNPQMLNFTILHFSETDLIIALNSIPSPALPLRLKEGRASLFLSFFVEGEDSGEE
jgi:hypothetical protein